MKNLIFTILGALVFCGLSAQEIPQQISYQGKLLENGSPVNDTIDFIFTIDTWSEPHNGVVVTDGLYSVTLGDGDPPRPIPDSIFNNSSSVNLLITVDDIDLSPQTELLSVPYAYKAEYAVTAENADSIGGNAVSATAPNADQILKWNDTSSTWEPGTDDTSDDWGAQTVVSDATLSGTGISGDSLSIAQQEATDGQVLEWNGSAWVPASHADVDSTNEIQNLSQVLTTGNNAGNQKITNLADPTSAQDAATKNYVDNSGSEIVTDQAYISSTNWFTTEVDVISVTVTVSSGGKVFIIYSGEAASSPGLNGVQLYISGGVNNNNNRRIYCSTNGEVYPFSHQYIDTPSSGQITYTLRAFSSDSGKSGKVYRVSLTAIVL